MNHAAVSLRVGRLRLAAALAAVALVAATWALWPAPRRGLVLYATSDGVTRLIRRFTVETGIPVTVVRLSTGPMLARIAAEGERPGWTLAWVDGDIAAAALDGAGLLERGLAPRVRWTPLGRALMPASGAWVPTGVTLAGVRLTRPGATGPMGMPDPAISGPAFPQIAGIVAQAGGWPQGKAALAGLRDAGLSVAPTSPAVVAEMQAGRIGSALIQSSTAYAMADRDAALRVAVPSPAILMPGVVMMAKGTRGRTRNEADRLIAFLLSDRAQRLRLTGATIDRFYWPLTGTPARIASLPPLASLRIIHLDPYRWARLQAEITAWFETEIAR